MGYGTGGQTRGFIHITDPARCIEIAISNPPQKGDRVEIFNQIAETCRVRDVAAMVAEQTGVEINRIPNPRQEAAENELDAKNEKFCNLGLDPITLDTGCSMRLLKLLRSIRIGAILPRSYLLLFGIRRGLRNVHPLMSILSNLRLLKRQKRSRHSVSIIIFH